MPAFPGCRDERGARDSLPVVRSTTHDPRPTTHDPRPTTHEPRTTNNDQHQQRGIKRLAGRFPLAPEQDTGPDRECTGYRQSDRPAADKDRARPDDYAGRGARPRTAAAGGSW